MDALPPEQCGGVRGRETAKASLFTRSFVAYCRRRGVPGAILYVEVCKAFDVVIRQFLFGVGGDQLNIDEAVANLDLEPAVAEHLATFLAERRG